MPSASNPYAATDHKPYVWNLTFMPALWVMNCHLYWMLKQENQHLNEVPGEQSHPTTHSINQQLSDIETSVAHKIMISLLFLDIKDVVTDQNVPFHGKLGNHCVFLEFILDKIVWQK